MSRISSAPPRLNPLMIDSALQTDEEQEIIKEASELSNPVEDTVYDSELIKTKKGILKTTSAIQELSSRSSSPNGYTIAYQKSTKQLHFDPGVYSHFQEIQNLKSSGGSPLFNRKFG